MGNKANPRETIITIWSTLTEKDRAALLPKLLTQTEGWRAWGFSDVGIISWLKWTFDVAEIPFRPTTLGKASGDDQSGIKSREVPPLRATAQGA
jgi:hypothetical protein